jgi:hypothetical protein
LSWCYSFLNWAFFNCGLDVANGAHEANKKADEAEYVAVFYLVGLQNNEPSNDGGMLFV